MISNGELKNKVSEFLETTGMSRTKFGILAKNDPNFVFRLLSGQDVRESGKIKVLKFIENFNKEKSHDIKKQQKI